MFSSFKNTELFRYFIRVDLNKGIDKIIKQNKSNFSLVAGSIFSGSFSILGTYFGMHESEYPSFASILLTTILFSILFYVGLFLFNKLEFIRSYLCNVIKKEKLPSKENVKEYIDNFDHIACDNILISKNFIMAYEDSKTSENLKEFYFYEIIYYTKVSLDIIHKLLVNKNKCINDKEHTNRIHLFRLENSLNMLEEIYHFIDGNKTQVACDQSLQNSLYKEIADLGTALNKYKGECDKIKLEIYR